MCNEDTGECDCAPNVIGERCDQCDADSYDYDDVLGCRVRQELLSRDFLFHFYVFKFRCSHVYVRNQSKR